LQKRHVAAMLVIRIQIAEIVIWRKKYYSSLEEKTKGKKFKVGESGKS